MNQKTKIALGGGGYCLYAPEFPRFQTFPGFSDEVHIYSAPVKPMFHLAFVEGRGAADDAVHCVDEAGWLRGADV